MPRRVPKAQARRIEIGCEADDAEAFRDWLIERGHKACVRKTTGSTVDGVWTGADAEAREAMQRLWAQYCNELT